ncbi:TPA_asm: hypothetical protein GYK08_11630 [Salmonella enterica subsp. enterica serovar Senftenberg]|nr:hypothetical protein [Salmonella enterica subsp. enterica serovar Senftenberg]
MFAGKKSAQIREILISESAWEEMTCLFAPSLANTMAATLYLVNDESRHPAVNRGSPPLPASFISSFVNEIVKSINAASGHPLPAEKRRYSAVETR